MRSTVIRPAGVESRLDRIGMLLSGLCAVHCVSTVILTLLLASVGGALLHPAIHEVGLAIAVAIGVIALGSGYLRHGRRVPTLVGGIGLTVMAGALALPHGLPEALATICGVSLLAFGHHLNRRAA